MGITHTGTSTHTHAYPRIPTHTTHIYVHQRTPTHIYAHPRIPTSTSTHISTQERGIPSTTGRFCVLEAARSSVGAWLFCGRACVLGTVSAQCMRGVSRYTTLHASFGAMYAQSQQMQDFAHVLWHSVCTESANARLLHTSLAATFSQYKSIFSGHAQALRDKPLRRRGTPPQ